MNTSEACKVETSKREDGRLNVWAFMYDPTIKDQVNPLDPKYRRWVVVGVIDGPNDLSALLKAKGLERAS